MKVFSIDPGYSQKYVSCGLVLGEWFPSEEGILHIKGVGIIKPYRKKAIVPFVQKIVAIAQRENVRIVFIEDFFPFFQVKRGKKRGNVCNIHTVLEIRDFIAYLAGFSLGKGIVVERIHPSWKARQQKVQENDFSAFLENLPFSKSGASHIMSALQMICHHLNISKVVISSNISLFR